MSRVPLRTKTKRVFFSGRFNGLEIWSALRRERGMVSLKRRHICLHLNSAGVWRTVVLRRLGWKSRHIAGIAVINATP
jgi:hypothetical protein